MALNLSDRVGRDVVQLVNTSSTSNSFPPQRTETVSLGTRPERNRCGRTIVEGALDNGNQELYAINWRKVLRRTPIFLPTLRHTALTWFVKIRRSSTITPNSFGCGLAQLGNYLVAQHVDDPVLIVCWLNAKITLPQFWTNLLKGPCLVIR